MAGTNRMDTSGLNYASAALPFVFGKRNWVVSLNYQRLYEMDKKVGFGYNWYLPVGTLNDTIRFSQAGFLYTVSPALAVQVSPEFSLGATVNFWDRNLGQNGWNNTYASRAAGTLIGLPVIVSYESRSRIDFEGTNAYFGFLWNFLGKFTLGGVYKMPFDARLKKRTAMYQRQDWTSIPFTIESRSSNVAYQSMNMPASYGLGLSYRHSDNWTTALDVYRTEWSRFKLEDEFGNDVNPVDGAPLSQGRLKDTTQVRLGTEYLFIKGKNVFPVRFGIFYDPEPTKDSPDDYYGFTAGLGFVRGGIAIDAAYQYRLGKNVSGDMASIPGTSARIVQHSGMVSVIYYF